MNLNISAQQPEWKKTLTEVLRKLGLVDKDSTGKVILHINQGNVLEGEIDFKLK